MKRERSRRIWENSKSYWLKRGTNADLKTLWQRTKEVMMPLLCGETSSYGSGDKDIVLIKTDPYGNTVGYEGE